jgi:transposase
VGPAPIASEALERIAGLYAIEKEIRGRSANERRTVRQDRSRPIIDDLEPWLRAKLALISQKSQLAEAIRYALSRWAGLTRFVDNGRIEIDSNVVERSIRPIATTCSLCPHSSSAWKHWKLILGIGATRATCSRDGRNDGVRFEIGRSNLIRRARHHLLSRQNAILDQAANPMVRDAKLCRGFRHR